MQCAFEKERYGMNLPAQSAAYHSNQYYREKEKAVFSTIPGMDELLTADRSSFYELEKKFPDAAFVLRTVSNLFTGDHEQNTIHQKAYSAILNGGSIPDARFRFNKDIDANMERHMWD